MWFLALMTATQTVVNQLTGGKLITPSLTLLFRFISDFGGNVPLLHLHGESSGRALVSSLLEIMLLPLHTPLAD